MTNSHLIIKTEKDGCSSWVLMYLKTAFFLTITRGKYMWLQKKRKWPSSQASVNTLLMSLWGQVHI